MQKSVPLLSICIPTYNRENFLKILLDSIVSQKEFSDTNSVEIVVDDGPSTDNTENMIKKYIKKYGDKIKYYRNPIRIGMCPAFLEALNFGNGKYLWLFGSDDVMGDCSLELLLSIISKNNPKLILSKHKKYEGFKHSNITQKSIYYFNGFSEFSKYLGTTNEMVFFDKDFLFTFISSFCLEKEHFNIYKEKLCHNYGKEYLNSQYFNFSLIAYSGLDTNESIAFISNPILVFDHGEGGWKPVYKIYSDLKFLLTMLNKSYKIPYKGKILFVKMKTYSYILCVIIPSIKKIIPNNIYKIFSYIYRKTILKLLIKLK